jgi:predicted Rossmann fold flavoprotein
MSKNSVFDLLIVGGGAAGFFTAITFAEGHPGAKVAILEKGREVLQKVKVSGGGRCNVTHACFDAKELVKNYPRGEKALIGPFHRFGPADTVEWFRGRGVKLKTEADGRMFPVTDNSETIVQCLTESARQAGVEVLTGQNVVSIQPPGESHPLFQIKTHSGEVFQSKNLMIATGSSPRFWEMLGALGHRIVPPVPSLFTFNIKDPRIAGLPGISVPVANVHVKGEKLSASGPLLITHWGMSGPAILRLSAWGARLLHERNYRFEIEVNWLGKMTSAEVAEVLNQAKLDVAKKIVTGSGPFSEIPKRLWESLVSAVGIPAGVRWADLNKEKLRKLAGQLTAASFQVNGKSTFKEEFVTAGGVHLDEVDFKKFESKIHPGLYFAGEVLDIDAITGGFNFQAAWTGGFVAGSAM